MMFTVGTDKLKLWGHDLWKRTLRIILSHENDRLCLLQNVISQFSPEKIAELRKIMDSPGSSTVIDSPSFQIDFENILNGIANSTEFFDPDCFRKSGLDHPMLQEKVENLPYQDKRILNLMGIRDALGLPSERASSCGRVVHFGDAQRGKSPLEEGLPPTSGNVKVDCTAFRIKGSDLGIFRITVEFAGRRSLTDWLSGFQRGKEIAVLKYGTIDNESTPTIQEMKTQWEKIFTDSPAVIQLPISDSGSVVMQYLANRSDISVLPKSTEEEGVHVSWIVSSDYEFATVERPDVNDGDVAENAAEVNEDRAIL